MFDKIYNKLFREISLLNANVLVVGDVMLDRYWEGDTERISPEAPVPVVTVKNKSLRVGGAGNVAVNITSLGAKARLLSMIGQDKAGQDLSALLDDHDVNNLCLKSEDMETTTKLRVLSQHQQLLRLDFESASEAIDVNKILDQYIKCLDGADLVVLSDYGKGMVSDPEMFINEADKLQKKVIVDPKYKDFNKYRGAYLITPNKKEFEAFVGRCETQAEIEEKAIQTIEQCNLGGLLITQGDKGMTLVMRNKTPVHFPTRAQEVYDVTGAGDTVVAALAVGLSGGMSVEDSVHLSSIAAGIVVGRVGTSFVSVEDILQAEHENVEKLTESKLCSSPELLEFVQKARLQNKTIVMTNGCFDLLHSGHVYYLEQAAKLGDVLIVAVNSDNSVRQLKGENRPINGLEERMAVLAGLSSVDKVVAFEDETPEQLICSVKPDYLVKGGDYEESQIAGRQCAKEVRLIAFVDGKSTSKTVNKIKEDL